MRRWSAWIFQLPLGWQLPSLIWDKRSQIWKWILSISFYDGPTKTAIKSYQRRESLAWLRCRGQDIGVFAQLLASTTAADVLRNKDRRQREWPAAHGCFNNTDMLKLWYNRSIGELQLLFNDVFKELLGSCFRNVQEVKRFKRWWRSLSWELRSETWLWNHILRSINHSIFIVVIFWPAILRPRQGTSRFAKKTSTIQYGSRKCG